MFLRNFCWIFIAFINSTFHCFALNKEIIYTKLNQPAPSWVMEQIEEDLGSFKTLGISQQAIERTLDQSVKLVLANIDQPAQPTFFARYRIINNCIYRKQETGYHVYLDQVLFNLSKIIQLPNVDFIICLFDGLPDYYAKRDYWITDNILDQAPLFCEGKRSWAKYAALIPDYSMFNIKLDIQGTQHLIDEILTANKMCPWNRKIKKAFWRGGPSDFWENPRITYPLEEMISIYSKRPRFVLCMQSLHHPNLIDANFVPYPDPQVGLNACLQTWFWQENLMKERRSTKLEHIECAYLPCLDGWMGTYPGYYWRLLSNSVVFKTDSDHQLWFYKALKEYEHYIPLNFDSTDILQKLEWAKEHDELCEEIAAKATQLVLNELSVEDNYLYLWRALKYYEGLQRFDCNILLPETSNSKEWLKIDPFRWE